MDAFFVCNCVCFCSAAVHSASVVRVVIQWLKLVCPFVDPYRAVPPPIPPASLLLCSAPPSASPRLLLANSGHLIKGLARLMLVSVPPHAGYTWTLGRWQGGVYTLIHPHKHSSIHTYWFSTPACSHMHTMYCRSSLGLLHWPRSAEEWRMWRGGVAGLAQGYCLVSPSLPTLSPALLTSPPCPSHCSRCPAKFMYPIIVLSRHVSSTVSTPLLCLAPACHHTETLPPAIPAVKDQIPWIYRC